VVAAPAMSVAAAVGLQDASAAKLVRTVCTVLRFATLPPSPAPPKRPEKASVIYGGGSS